jgi:ankyrin repeat protein
MQDPNHVELISAIEDADFDRANEILANDHENIFVLPVGALQVTAFQMAAWQGRTELLEKLWEKGFHVNDVDRIGRSALYHAAHNGDSDVVSWILERGGYVDAQVGVHTCTNDMPNPTLTSCSVGRKVGQTNH